MLKVDLWLIRDIFSVDLSMQLGKFPNEPNGFPDGTISLLPLYSEDYCNQYSFLSLYQVQ